MLQTNQERQDALEELLKLRYPAVTVTLLDSEDDIPENAICPKDAWGKHIALCQAFAYARRQNKIIALRLQDQWCWTPLMCYGFCESGPGTVAFNAKVAGIGAPDQKKAEEFVDKKLPRLPLGKCKVILLAPLQLTDWKHDLTVIYSNTAQLRLMLMAVFSQTGEMLDSSFMPLESCIYSVIPPIQEGKYRITLPDPGEYERAFTGDDQIIFSVPAPKEEEFWAGVERQRSRGVSVNSFYPMMKEDFARPEFYNRVFESWGLETSELWDKQIVPPGGKK